MTEFYTKEKKVHVFDIEKNDDGVIFHVKQGGKIDCFSMEDLLEVISNYKMKK